MEHASLRWTCSALAVLVLAGRGALGQQAVPAAQPGAAAEASADQAAPQTEDPAVLAVLATNPSTPWEWARAAKILADLQHPDLAKGFLNKILNQLGQLDAAERRANLLDLEARFGAAMFLEMAGRHDLRPESVQLNQALLSALDEHLRDPKRLAQLIDQLDDSSALVRRKALEEIRRSRGHAVGPLLAVLADPSRRAEHPQVRAAVAHLGADAKKPLLAALQAEQPAVVAAAVDGLAQLGDPSVVEDLLAAAFAAEQPEEVRTAARAALVQLAGGVPSLELAWRLLAQKAEGYYRGTTVVPADVNNQVEMWLWDPQTKQLVQQKLAADDARRLLALRYARQAYQLGASDSRAELLYLATMVEVAAFGHGLDEPLPTGPGSVGEQLLELEPVTLEALVRFGMETDHPVAAAVGAQLLGRRGSAELLFQGPQPSVLAEALRHPDRRLRFAALEAVIQLGPSETFPGCSRVGEALSFFASSVGARRLLVASPSMSYARLVGGYLEAHGYQVDTATTGKEALRLLISSADYEFALLDAALAQPTIGPLLQQLRHDCRTCEIPIGILAGVGQYDRAKAVAEDNARCAAFHRPVDAQSVQWQVDRLKQLTLLPMVPAAVRRRQSLQSLGWLARLAQQKPPLFDLLQVEPVLCSVVTDAELGPIAAEAIGLLGTPTAQTTLIDLASRATYPLSLRQAAARAFQKSVEQHGILLAGSQILLQYDRYNQSAALDSDTRQILGFLLDVIEAPSKRVQTAPPNLAPTRG